MFLICNHVRHVMQFFWILCYNNAAMALRGWRLFGVAGTIFVYIAGILFLSFVSLQNPNQKRAHNRNYGETRDLGLLGKKPPLQWCQELRYLDSPPPPPKSFKLMYTFPGHLVKKLDFYSYKNSFLKDDSKKRDNEKNKHNDAKESSWPINNNNINSKVVDNKLNDKTRDLTALVSFPGSGNTWLRYLLQQATGIYTGSVYKDYGLLKSGFPAENVANKSVLAIKTHEWGHNAWSPYSRAILLVRDPAKSILAEFNRQSGGHVGFASPDRYRRTKGRYWTQFVKNKLWAWEQTNLSWAKNFTGDIKIIFYDDLVNDVEGTLRDILKFLEFPISEELLSCALVRREGIYRRKKRLLQFDPYSPAMHVAIDEKRAEVYAALGRVES